MASESLGLKGLNLGASKAEIQKHYPKADCTLGFSCWYYQPPDKTKGSATIAGVHLPAILFKIHDGKLSGIFMSPASSSFNQISTAFTDKYGKPDMREIVPLRTLSGVEYKNEVLVWKRADGVIRIERFSDGIMSSLVTFQTYGDVSRGLAARDAARKAAASDL